jgi:hypothetical protein
MAATTSATHQRRLAPPAPGPAGAEVTIGVTVVTFFLYLVLVGGAIVAIVAMTLGDPDKPATEVRTPTRDRLRRLSRIDLARLTGSGLASRPSDDTGATSLQAARARIEPDTLSAPSETPEPQPEAVTTALLVAGPASDEPLDEPHHDQDRDDGPAGGAPRGATWPQAPEPAPGAEATTSVDAWAAATGATAAATPPTAPAARGGEADTLTWRAAGPPPAEADPTTRRAEGPSAVEATPLRRSARLLRGTLSLILLLTVLGTILAAVLAGAAAAVAIGVRAAIG